jgi:methanogenic corrinoid protein MtbC1
MWEIDFDELGSQFEEALLLLDRVAARKIFDNAAGTYTPLDLTERLIGPTLFRIGVGWEQGRIALSQVYMSGRLCEELIHSLLPLNCVSSDGQPKMAIAVLEDHHVLGKRIIYSALAAAGYSLLDYGIGVSVEQVVERAQVDQIELLLISTLMFRAALRVELVTAQLPQTRVIVGGAPFLFDNRLWQKVGATAMGRNSAEAIDLVSKILEKQP